MSTATSCLHSDPLSMQCRILLLLLLRSIRLTLYSPPFAVFSALRLVLRDPATRSDSLVLRLYLRLPFLLLLSLHPDCPPHPVLSGERRGGPHGPPHLNLAALQ